jgi:hypothetical protein
MGTTMTVGVRGVQEDLGVVGWHLLGLCQLTHGLPVLSSGSCAGPAGSEWVGVQDGDSGGGLRRVKGQIITERSTEKK